MPRVDVVSVEDIAGFWNTGPVTVRDLIETGEVAIRWHHIQAQDLAAMAHRESWTRGIMRLCRMTKRIDKRGWSTSGYVLPTTRMYRTRSCG